MSKLIEIVRNMTSKQRQEFSELFLSIWCEHGFGTFSKKDTELLIYSCLDHVLDRLKPRGNYNWAKTLGITQTKVKSLQLESYLRFGPYFEKRNPDLLIAKCLNNILEIDVATGIVKVLVEDPVAHLELEKKLKDINSTFDYERNREIIRINIFSFIRVIALISNVEEDSTVQKLASLAHQKKEEYEKVVGQMSAASYAKLSEAQKVGKFLELLGNTFAEKPTKLIEHIGIILKSQKHHG